MSFLVYFVAVFVSLVLVVAIVRFSFWMSEKGESRRVDDASYGAPMTSDCGPAQGGGD